MFIYTLSNDFLLICALSFYSLNGVLWKVGIFILMRSKLSNFSFMNESLFSVLNLRNLCLTFFCKFYGFRFTFSSMKHFEFIYVYDWAMNQFFCTGIYPIVPGLFVEQMSLSPLCFYLCQESIARCVWIYFWTVYSIPVTILSILHWYHALLIIITLL